MPLGLVTEPLPTPNISERGDDRSAIEQLILAMRLLAPVGALLIISTMTSRVEHAAAGADDPSESPVLVM